MILFDRFLSSRRFPNNYNIIDITKKTKQYFTRNIHIINNQDPNADY